MASTNMLYKTLNRISATYILLFCFVPPIQVGTIYRVLAIGASGLWVITVYGTTKGQITRKAMKFAVLSVACILLMFLARTNIDSASSAFANVLQPIIIVLVALISMYAFRYDIDYFRIILPVIMALLCFYSVETIQAAIENPYASRIANADWLEERFAGNENVGLYGYIYMNVFLVPILLYKIIKRIRISFIIDILAIIVLILSVVMSAVSGYMIANFLVVLGIIMASLLHKITKPRLVIVAVLGLTLWMNQEVLIEQALNTVTVVVGDNPVYNDKIDGFEKLYEEGELGETSWGGRIKNYLASVDMVVRYPVLGCYYWGEPGGGGHSYLLDTIGRFGWLTATLYFTIMWKYPRMIAPGVEKNHPLYIIVLIISIVFALVDPYCQELALPLFIFMPYIVYLEENQQGN